MKTLFGFIKPQIAFGAGGRGGGGKSSPKPTGFTDQAARMANSQRQLGAPQMPGFNMESQKDVPSVAKRKPQKDNSPINVGSGGFNTMFNKTPKAGQQNGYKFKNIGNRVNPITGKKEQQSVIIDPNGGMKKTDYADKFRDRDNRNIGMHQGLAASTGKSRNIMTSGGKLGVMPDGSTIKGGIEFDGQGNTYSSSTGGRLDLSGIGGVATPAKKTSRPANGGKGGGGIAAPAPSGQAPTRTPSRLPPAPPGYGYDDTMTLQPLDQIRTFGDGRGNAERQKPASINRTVAPSLPKRNTTTPPNGGKGGGVRQRTPVMVDPRNPVGAPDPVDPRQQVAIGRQQQFPMGPRRYAPNTAGGSYQMMGGGKGGGARVPMQQRRPEQPFTYNRPKR